MINTTNTKQKSSNYYLRQDFTRYATPITRLLLILILISLTIILAAKYFTPADTNTLDDTDLKTLTFTNADNIPTLKFGHYALWTESSTGEFIFIKRFNVVNQLFINLDGSDLTEISIPSTSISTIHITIEPEWDRNEHSSEVLFLSGLNVTENSTITLQLSAPINKDYHKAIGTYTLATPTDRNENINEKSGIWFWDYTNGNTSLSNLPSITDPTWTYKAITIYKEDIYLPIGEFNTTTAADNYNRYSLTTDNGFNVPGEDFLKDLPNNLIGPINLTKNNSRLIISLAPKQSISGFPHDTYFIPILMSDVPADPDTHINLPLDNVYSQPQIIIEYKTTP